MALDKGQLQNTIKNLMDEMLTREENSIDEFADRLAKAIHDYVTKAEIIYTTGLTAPNGPVTGTFKGSLK